MKLLFYSDTVFSFGGVQRVLAEIAKALAKCHEVIILSTDTNRDITMYGYDQSNVLFDFISYSPSAGLQNLFCKSYSFLYKKVLPQTEFTSALYARSFFLPSYRKALIEKINAGGYDVVIGVHVYLSLQLAAIRNNIGAKTIGWMHNSYAAFFEKEHPYLPELREFFKYQMKKLDKVVVLSHSDADLFLRKMGLQTEVIYNPLTVEPVGRGKFQYKKFLSVGRFAHQHKGYDILIKAFAEFAKTNAEWKLEIVGEGPEEELYRGLIKEYGLEERVALCPFTKDIQSHYAHASVYVLSSRWEGFGLVLIEAIAHGLPVISSNIPVAVELLRDRGVAVFFENGDILSLTKQLRNIVDQADWDVMGKNSLAYAAMFQIDRISASWNLLFEKK